MNDSGKSAIAAGEEVVPAIRENKDLDMQGQIHTMRPYFLSPHTTLILATHCFPLATTSTIAPPTL